MADLPDRYKWDNNAPGVDNTFRIFGQYLIDQLARPSETTHPDKRNHDVIKHKPKQKSRPKRRRPKKTVIDNRSITINNYHIEGNAQVSEVIYNKAKNKSKKRRPKK